MQSLILGTIKAVCAVINIYTIGAMWQPITFCSICAFILEKNVSVPLERLELSVFNLHDTRPCVNRCHAKIHSLPTHEDR